MCPQTLKCVLKCCTMSLFGVILVSAVSVCFLINWWSFSLLWQNFDSALTWEKRHAVWHFLLSLYQFLYNQQMAFLLLLFPGANNFQSCMHYPGLRCSILHGPPIIWDFTLKVCVLGRLFPSAKLLVSGSSATTTHWSSEVTERREVGGCGMQKPKALLLHLFN